MAKNLTDAELEELDRLLEEVDGDAIDVRAIEILRGARARIRRQKPDKDSPKD